MKLKLYKITYQSANFNYLFNKLIIALKNSFIL